MRAPYRVQALSLAPPALGVHGLACMEGPEASIRVSVPGAEVRENGWDLPGFVGFARR